MTHYGMGNNKIREWLSRKGITAKELASSINISPSYLSLILNGKRQVKLELAQEICSVLGISLIDAFPPKFDGNKNQKARILLITSDVTLSNRISSGNNIPDLDIKTADTEFVVGLNLGLHNPQYVFFDMRILGVNIENMIKQVRNANSLSTPKLVCLYENEADCAKPSFQGTTLVSLFQMEKLATILNIPQDVSATNNPQKL